MFDYCPIKKEMCPFCGISQGEKFCGIGTFKKGYGIVTKIADLKECAADVKRAKKMRHKNVKQV